MEITESQRRLLALCAIRVDGESVDWNLIARQAQFSDGVDALWAGRIFENPAAANDNSIRAQELASQIPVPLIEEHVRVGRGSLELTTGWSHGVTAIARNSVLPNLPPLPIYYRGALIRQDAFLAGGGHTHD